MDYSEKLGNSCEHECSPITSCEKVNNCDAVGTLSGIKRLQSKKYNKGLAFTQEERQFLCINGLLPAVVKTEEQQIQHCLILVNRLKNNLDKYRYLISLAERNQLLFYKLLMSDVFEFLPIIYTPTVGEACLNYGMIYEHPQGLFINILEKGNVYETLSNWPERDVRAIVVTDGERIFGLGDLGAYSIAIAIGKLMLYTVLGGLKPQHCLPIVLDCGTSSDNLIIDPLYIGLREHRIRGRAYDEFIDEFMHAVVRRFGRTCLIQFEDFGNANAFRLLDKYRNNFCTFNDDIQGTASVVLSGILVALKVTQTSLKSQTVLFYGAGEACIGIARLFQYAVMRSGTNEKDAKRNIWLFDTKGLIVTNRPAGGLTNVKLEFAQVAKPIDDFLEVISRVRPTILIGAAAVPDVFTPEILNLMANINERPIIFALSNPTNKAECTAEAAYIYTQGRCLFAAGSPFPPVDYKRKRYFPGQANNAAIFPGLALGILCSGMLKIPEEVFLIAAETLADIVSVEDVANGSLYPPPSKMICSSIQIARWVMEYAYRFNLATVFPEPKNKMEFIREQMYEPSYVPIIPEVYLKDEIW